MIRPPPISTTTYPLFPYTTLFRSAVGYCLGGKLCYLMCGRTDIDCAVAYYGTYIEHNIREVGNLHRPFMLHMAMKDRWVQREVNDLLMRSLSPNQIGRAHV